MLQASADNLPDIEAHQFKIVPLEKSRTGRVYRFKVDAEQLPKVGNILLIEENDKPTMAFRVMKTDFDHSEFVAKRVRRYDVSSELKINERYTTVEKISDLVAPPPPETPTYDPNAKPLLDPNPSKNLVGKTDTGATPPQLSPFNGTDTTAANTSPPPADTGTFTPTTNNGKPLDVEKYDDDLDSSTSPTNLKGDNTMDAATPGAAAAPDVQTATDEGGYDLEVKERPILNPFKYMVGFEIASMKNMSNEVFGSGSFGGFSLFFSQVIRRDLIFKKTTGPQDSLSIEYGFSYYNDDNVNGVNDDYEILPLKVELRYDMHLSESFTPFVYFGAQYNLILSAANQDNKSGSATSVTYNNLHGPQANIGVGIFYNIGPQWYLRGDIGLDRLAIGLAVRW